MSDENEQTRFRRNTPALSVWENEGGAPARETIDCDYGRRIEGDRSWTVYHVFTGAPARIDGETMTCLSRSQATDSMLSLNKFNTRRRTERGRRSTVTLIEGARQP